MHFGGGFAWFNASFSETVPNPPAWPNMRMSFDYMNLPDLDVQIENEVCDPATGSALDVSNGLAPGTLMQIKTRIRNTNANSVGRGFKQRFPMSVRVINEGSYPTRGLMPYVDSSHPITVSGAAGASFTSSTNASYVTAGGSPINITLGGTDVATITYYATVASGGGEVRVSSRITESSFQGSVDTTTRLVPEMPLVSAPGDPSDTGAGTSYHFARTSANSNGWNQGAVEVEFFSGTYAKLLVTDASGNVTELAGSNLTYRIEADTAGTDLKYQAVTSAGIESVMLTDVVRIDSVAPALAYDAETMSLNAEDPSASEGGDTQSGIWKIVKVDSQDAEPADGRDGAVYTGVNGIWAPEASLSRPYPGVYVAIDAAGNVSGEVEVPSLGLPSVARPESGGNNGGSEDDGDDGDAYAGPVFKGAVPAGELTVDGNGLNHRVIQEGVFEVVDNSMEKGDLPFGGTLDEDAAKQLIERNYSFTSPVGGDSPIDVKVELIDARTGKPAGLVDTSKTGEYMVRATATDAQGNTTTVEVACRLANKDDLPQVTPKPGKPNPDDPFGELIVDGDGTGDAQAPLEAKDVKVDEGTGKVTGTVEASLYVPRSDTVATPDDIATLISNRYDVGSLIGGNGASIARGEVVLKDSKGNPIEGIDLSKTGSWTAEQTLTDSFGNTTTLRVTITNRKGGGGAGLLPDLPSIEVTPTTDIRLDPEVVGTVKDEPYFEHDSDRPVNILDMIQVRPEGADEWSAVTGSGNGSGNGATPDQLPANVKVTVTDEAGKQIDGTNITSPGTYTVTVSVKDSDSGEYIVIEILTFHIVDTSITDTDYIYKDVAKDHWGHGYIFDIGPAVINGAFNPSDVALGYMAGYAGTTDFGPSNGIIRGDAAIVIWRMAGCPDIEDQDVQQLLSLANTYYTGFTDCDSDPTAYYNKAIAWCAANGIVTGYEGTGEYRPQNKITREEFASIIARYASFKGKDVTSADADLSQYPDIDSVSEWAAPNMGYVVANGIMTGRGTDEGTADGTHGILDPQADVTRAEVAKMAYMEQPCRR